MLWSRGDPLVGWVFSVSGLARVRTVADMVAVDTSTADSGEVHTGAADTAAGAEAAGKLAGAAAGTEYM